MAYKAVLFDLDGTLLDTLDDISNSINEALNYFGLGSIGKNDVRRLVGNGVRRLAEGALIQLTGDTCISDDMLRRFLDVYIPIYNKNSIVKTKPYNGIPEILGWLKGQGVYTGVLSNKPHPTAIEVLRIYFPRHVFDFVMGQREGEPQKPDPAGAYEFCKTLGLSTDEVLFVGDSEVDLETGKNAGIDCAGVLWGFRDEETLSKCGAKALITSPDEIKRFIG